MLSVSCFEHLLPAGTPPTTPDVSLTTSRRDRSHLRSSLNVTVAFTTQRMSTFKKLIPLCVCVCACFAGTLLIGVQTWTECSTSMQATGQCTPSGSWTEKRTPGTTSPSSPQSSVSAAGRVADFCLFFSVSPLVLLFLPAKFDFWS